MCFPYRLDVPTAQLAGTTKKFIKLRKKEFFAYLCAN